MAQGVKAIGDKEEENKKIRDKLEVKSEKKIFFFDLENIDTEWIIQSLQKKIDSISLDESEKKILYKDIQPPAADSSFIDAFQEKLEILNRKWTINVDYKITSHRRFFGTPIVLLKKITRKLLRWLIIWPLKDIEEFNENTVHTLYELKDGLAAFQQVQNEVLDQLSNENQILKKKFKEISVLHSDIAQYINGLKDEISQIKTISRISNERTRRLENWYKNNLDIDQNIALSREFTAVSGENSVANLSPIELDVFLYEELYRGNKNLIQERQKAYLQYFKNKSHVIDLGSGRGEFLTLLKNAGVSAVGIDSNKDMVNYSLKKGLNVEHRDILNYLRAVGDNSLGGVFLGNVIEYITLQELYELIILVYQKMLPGAFFVIESLNPNNISNRLNHFILDLLPGKTLHPETLLFLLETSGLESIKIEYTNQIPGKKHIDINSLTENEDLNNFLQPVDKLFNGKEYYSIVGRK